MDRTSSRTSGDPEKHESSISEASASANPSPALLLDPAMQKKVWRKMDLWIIPVVTMFYLLSFLDRSNIGNARVAGLQKDLHMTNKQYSIALTVTYVPYIAAELPSNLVLKIVGPNWLLPTMLTLWGIVTALQGVVTTYEGLLACRFFLGLFEGGVFPGLVLYLSFFYPRLMLQWRVSAFFSAASISGAFSGLLAYGIVNMDGVGGRRGWEWIFILEGVFTVAFGLVSFFLLPRSPAHAHFLTKEEKEYVHAVLKEDGATGKSEADDNHSWTEVIKAFKLPQVWILSVTLFFDGTILFGLAYFAPSIVQGLGYTANRAQLMTVPPFAVAFGLAMVGAYVSDRYRCRGYITMFGSLLCVIGFAMFLGSNRQRVRYGSLFFSIPGTYLVAPTLSTWNANNAAPYTRRATAIAIGFIFTNSGGILATWLLGNLSPGPAYKLATRVLLSFSALMVATAALNTWYLWNENKKKAVIRGKITRDQEKPGLGDRSAWFEYAL
ncbi:putative transporter [Psilocybe cubensis]|uniref:Transporter n=2 Tax=Psilocybe cubensis TaxID=181762 RepID=A0ACB8H310_PSICU|nr:putative transporter [Psilocybe cubensis]KAH9482229.1 putative transporter [Psilocybe cubensis]